MTFSKFFWGLGDLLTWMLQALQGDAIGNTFNYILIVFGFIAFGIWMRMQARYNAAAKSNPNQLK